MHGELFWIRSNNDIYEKALDSLTTPSVPPSARLRWADLELLEFKKHSVLIEPSSGSWVGLSLPCRSLEEAKTLLPEPAAMPRELTSFLFRRNVLTDDTGTSFYPPTIETTEGRNLPIRYLFVIETTDRCNLGCSYCFKSASPRGVSMTEEMAGKVASYIHMFCDAAVAVEFSGGEPTLNPKVINIIASKLTDDLEGVRFSLQTNATLVNNDLIELARRFNIIVGSSLEGSVEDLRRLRPFADGEDASECILSGIRKLKAEGLLGGIVSVFSEWLSGQPQDLLALLDSVGATSVKLNLCTQLGRGNQLSNKIGERLRHYAEFMKHLVEDGFSRLLPIREGNTATIADRILGRIPEYRCMNSPCDAGYTFQNVRPNGDIYACDRYSRFVKMKLGNVESFLASGRDCNNHDESIGLPISVDSIPYKMSKRTVRSVNVCSKCTLRPYCGGGCAMESFCRFGSFDQPSAQCEFLKQHIPQVFEWLINSEQFRATYYPGGCQRHSHHFSHGTG